MIIYRKNKIGKVKHNLQQQYKDQLDFNGDTVWYFGDRGYLLLSVHLTSKEGRFKQAEEMFKVLEDLKRDHPMLKIIIGGDFNQYLNELQGNFLHSVP